MRLSLFDNDSGFGDIVGASAGGGVTLGGGRNLEIVGTLGKGTWGDGLISLVSLADNYIAPAFTRGGWSLQGRVDLTWDASIQRYRYRIPVWVFNQYSDVDVVNGARSTLLGIRQGALGLQTFSDVTAALERPSASVGPNTGTPAGGGNTGGGSLDSWVPASLQGSLSPLAVGLGVTTGTVLVGGILIAIIILKKS